MLVYMCACMCVSCVCQTDRQTDRHTFTNTHLKSHTCSAQMDTVMTHTSSMCYMLCKGEHVHVRKHTGAPHLTLVASLRCRRCRTL